MVATLTDLPFFFSFPTLPFFPFLPSSFPLSFSGVGQGGWLQRRNLVPCVCQALPVNYNPSPLLRFVKKSRFPRLLSLNSIYAAQTGLQFVLLLPQPSEEPGYQACTTGLGVRPPFSCNKLFWDSMRVIQKKNNLCSVHRLLVSFCNSGFFGFPPSFLLKYFLNNLNLVRTPEICPVLGQVSLGGSRAPTHLAGWGSQLSQLDLHETAGGARAERGELSREEEN